MTTTTRRTTVLLLAAALGCGGEVSEPDGLVLSLGGATAVPVAAGMLLSVQDEPRTLPRVGPDIGALRQQVVDTEKAFAATMAARDHAAFATFVADEAVFFDPGGSLRGKQKVVDYWARFFQEPEAPFSWEPDEVEVLDSGTLALSSGPVKDPSGKVVARFNSIWRLEAEGAWRIVFDRGNEVCD